MVGHCHGAFEEYNTLPAKMPYRMVSYNWKFPVYNAYDFKFLPNILRLVISTIICSFNTGHWVGLFIFARQASPRSWNELCELQYNLPLLAFVFHSWRHASCVHELYRLSLPHHHLYFTPLHATEAHLSGPNFMLTYMQKPKTISPWKSWNIVNLGNGFWDP